MVVSYKPFIGVFLVQNISIIVEEKNKKNAHHIYFLLLICVCVCFTPLSSSAAAFSSSKYIHHHERKKREEFSPYLFLASLIVQAVDSIHWSLTSHAKYYPTHVSHWLILLQASQQHLCHNPK